MNISAVSIDFWETLYFDRGTPEFHKQVRTQALARHLESRGFKGTSNLAEMFFEMVDSYIRTSWVQGVCPTKSGTLRHVYEQCERVVPAETCEELLNVLYEVYTDQLCPELAQDGREFVEWLSARWPLYMVSDTFTLVGTVLDKILEKDNLISFFTARFYSDQLGRQKPDPMSILRIASLEHVNPNQIVHIGDLLKTDSELARRAGCSCIIVNRTIQTQIDQLHDWNKETLIGYCENLTQARGIMHGNTSVVD